MVDQAAFGVALGREVHVEFAARAAGAGVAHHPEVVFLVAVDDVDLRVEAGGAELLGPDVVGFLVELAGVAFALVRRIDGGVEAVLGELPDFGDQFPGPVDGFLLEVIAEGPVAEHLEEGVVVGVEADVFEVVVLAAGADAFLGVGGAGVAAGDGAGPLGDVRGALAEEDRHELVHAGVGEQQVGRVRHQARGGHDGVPLRLEEIEERLAYFRTGHGGNLTAKNAGNAKHFLIYGLSWAIFGVKAGVCRDANLAIASPLISTAASARWGGSAVESELFQQFAAWDGKPMKRLRPPYPTDHWAEPAVLMRGPVSHAFNPLRSGVNFSFWRIISSHVTTPFL